MKIAIMGSGGVGGYFGAWLAQGGADVTFIARGAHLAAMRQNGLAIEGPRPLHLPKVQATDDPRTIGPVALVIFSVKLWDTESAARALLPVMKPGTGVVSFQNGVKKDEMLTPILGNDAVFGGVSYIGASIARPGVILQTGPMQRLVFGEYDGSRSPRVEAFLAACQKGGINAEVSADIVRSIWEKFAFLAGGSATTTAMRSSIGPIRARPETRQFLLDVMKEVVAVGRARGVALPAGFAEQRMSGIDQLAPEMIASMYHDLQHGKPLELRWLSGDVVALGAEAGVPTPMNRAVRDILLLHADGRKG